MPLSELSIWTIGHSTRTFEEFTALLEGSHIECIADVRSFPGSRKFPHFNREALQISLPAHGVDYVHIKDLGGRRRVRPDSQNTVWRNASFRGYADYMETQSFRDGIDLLVKLAKAKATAIMCSEAVWWRCHRSMISDYLKAAGATVLHINSGGIATHPFTAAAKILDGELYYGPGDEVTTSS